MKITTTWAAVAMLTGAVCSQELVYVEEDFDQGIPATWTVLDVACPATNWYGTTGGYAGNYLDGTEFAFIDSDAAGQFCAVEDYLISPAFDATASSSLRIRFDHYYRHYVTDAGTVQVWDGAAWVDVATYTATIGDWGAPDLVDLDLSAHINDALQVRFKYTGNWDWWWAVDDVVIYEPLAPPGTYCTAKVNSQGCTPLIGSSGTPSASDPTPFDVTASMVINNKNGILFYGLNGPNNLPFQGGWLCVQPPLKRTPIQNSGGNPPPDDCSGTYTFDFNAWLQGGSDPGVGPGVQVHGQYWQRDPQSPSTTGLTDAIAFAVGS